MIPGLEQAEFVRYGVMHRNTYINSPRALKTTLQFVGNPRLFFTGQMTGVEGYVESAAMGLIAGLNAARLAAGREPVTWPPVTAHGALVHYITNADPDNFQPMNVISAAAAPCLVYQRSRKLALAERASELEQWRSRILTNFTAKNFSFHHFSLANSTAII